jgi:hypothetical protein
MEEDEQEQYQQQRRGHQQQQHMQLIATGRAAQATSAFLHGLLSRSLRSPLRSALGIINMGNSCYISAGLQVLAGLRPLIQFFVVERAHEAILQRKKATRRTLPPPPPPPSQFSYSSSYTSSLFPNSRASAPAPQQSLNDPQALPHNFGELTTEFAIIMQQSEEKHPTHAPRLPFSRSSSILLIHSFLLVCVLRPFLVLCSACTPAVTLLCTPAV